MITIPTLPLDCWFSQSTERDLKLGDITIEVVEKVVALCPDCGFTDTSIDKQSFSCYPNSPSFVTYRARLERTSLTDSDNFISLIEQWVSDGASVIVSGVLLKVDSKCLVEISDLSEDECIMKPVVIAPTPVSRTTTLVTTEPTPSGQDDPQSLTIILTVIGIIVIVIVSIIAVTATIIAVLVLRNRRAEYALNSSAKMCVTIIKSTVLYFVSFVHRSGSMEAKGSAIQTTNNEAYAEMKQGGGGGGGGGESGEAYEMMDVTPTVTTPTNTGPTSAASLEGMYETPSASSQPLPAMPPPPDTNEKEEEDSVYEVIPGDK